MYLYLSKCYHLAQGGPPTQTQPHTAVKEDYPVFSPGPLGRVAPMPSQLFNFDEGRKSIDVVINSSQVTPISSALKLILEPCYHLKSWQA